MRECIREGLHGNEPHYLVMSPPWCWQGLGRSTGREGGREGRRVGGRGGSSFLFISSIVGTPRAMCNGVSR